MASVNWITNAGTSDWSVAANWSPGTPGPGDDATIGVSGTVTVTVTSAEEANSLTLNDAHATLAVGSALTIGTTLAVSAGTVSLNAGGTIIGGTIVGGGVQFSGGTLSGVDYVGTLDLSRNFSHLVVTNGIQLTPTSGSGPVSVMLTGFPASLDFDGSQTLDNAAVALGGSLTALSGTLTLGPTTSIDAGGTLAALAGATIVNMGSITASGAYFDVVGTFINQSAISINTFFGFHGFRAGSATFINAVGGSLAIGTKASGTLGSAVGAFSNQGTVTVGTGARLYLDGSFDQTNIGAITNSGGEIVIKGTWNNAGTVISTGTASSLGTITLAAGGTIVGGTIVGGGAKFNFGTLSGVTYVGALDLSRASARVTVSNGITLSPTSGSGPDGVLIGQLGKQVFSGGYSYLDFAGTQTLSNAAISLGSTAVLHAVGAGTTLTLDASTSITEASQGGGGQLYAKAGAGIVNQGMIVVGTAGTDAGVAIRGNFTNQGTITVTSTAGVGARGGTFDNAAGGLLTIGTSSYAALGSKGDTFSNQGTVTLNTGAKLHLGGAFLQSDLTGITNSGGTVFLDGILSNTGTVLSGAAAGGLGTVVLDGTVVGGTLVGGGVLFRSGTLANVSYVGTLDLSAAGSRLTVANGIALSPSAGSGPDTVLVTGNSSYLDFIGSQTVNNVEITLGAAGLRASLRAIGTSTSLTFGQGMTLNPVGAAVLYAMAGDTIDNTGTITLAAANSGLGIGGSFFNDGVITVSNKDSLSVGSMGGSGSVTLSGGATVSFKGAVGSGEMVAFLDHSGRLNVSQPSSFAASVQGFLDGDTIDLLGIGVAASTTYDSVNHQLLLKNAGGTQVAQLSLSLSPNLTNPQFVLGKDTGGGTLLTVQNGNSSGTLTGTYTGGLVLSDPTLQNPITLAAGSYVTNNTTSHSGDAVYGTTAAAWQITSYGTIKSNAAAGAGIDLRAGGTVTIKAGGAVTGTDDGIDISSAAGNVTNAGYIKGRIGGLTSGIDLKAGGTVINQAGGTILGGNYGVSGEAYGGVTNAGYIGGAVGGVFLNSGGIVTNQAGGTITALFPILFRNTAATLINAGTIRGKSIAVFVDSVVGVVINQQGGIIKGPVGFNTAIFGRMATGYVNNAGYIGGASAIIFNLGGTVINQIGGTIAGTANGFICAPFGTIASGPGTLTNAGTVSGGTDGVYLTAGGTITNQSSGSILGTGTSGVGVMVTGGAGTLANAGLVSGTQSGVLLKAGGSLLNSGTIVGSSGTAVSFSGTGASRLVLDPGYILSGIVVGSTSSGATNTLELASAASVGTLSKPIQNEFLNIGTIEIDSGAQWVLPGYHRIGSGITLNNAGTLTVPKFLIFNSSTMTNSGSVSGSIRLAGASYLDNSGTICAIGSAVYGYGGANTIVNAGTISGSAGIGIFLRAGGGTLANSAATAIVAGYDAGVKIGGGAGTISNSGTIVATHLGPYLIGDAVYLLSGGTVSNSGTIEANHHGVLITGAAGTLDNLGTIAGTGGVGVSVYLEGGGYVHNASTGVIAGSNTGVTIRTVLVDGTLVNQGTIWAERSGVALEGGGYVSNAATGLIISNYVGVISGSGKVANSGTIQSIGTFGDGVDLLFGGAVSNAATGLIVGTRYGVLIIHDAGTITNSGTVAATGSMGVDGIYLITGGSIGNASTGLITGPKAGVLVTGSAGAVVNSGMISGGTVGTELLAGGTIIDSGTIAGGGTAILLGGSASNLVVLEPGFQLTGNVIGSSAAGATDTLELDGHAGNPLTANYNSLNLINFEAVAFGSGGYSTLGITNTAGIPGIVFSGFTLTSETIDLTAIGTDGTISNTDTINHLVTITGSLGAVTLQLDAIDSVNLATASDGVTGTNVSPVCFCRGTTILTEAGEVAVEDLKVGDRVRTLSGELKPIVWIGFGRDLVTRRNSLARPIIVRQSALAEGVPVRDLYLTHGHGLYIDGVLIPVENLVNHRSIVWDETARVVEFFHIELQDHDVVLANGAPTESYYDASNRAQFHNTRPGSVSSDAKPTFAHVLNGGDAVERAWARLFARSGGRIVQDTTDDPDLHLVVDGRRLDPAALDGSTYSFTLAAPPGGAILICSCKGVPSLLGVTAHDHRRLGVALARIVISQPGVTTVIESDAPVLLAGGCHPAEGGYAWTDGELTLSPNLFAHLSGPFTVAVELERPGMRYPLFSTALAAA